MKTIKDMFEVYRPKSPDEQKFVDKHVTVKIKDRNEVNGKANGDDVFKATNIKAVERKKTRHGYDLGADEKVYEENEFVNEEELIDEGMLDFMKKKKPKVTVGKMTRIADLPDGEKPFQKMAAIRDKKQMTKEEIEQLDELSPELYSRAQHSASDKAAATPGPEYKKNADRAYKFHGARNDASERDRIKKIKSSYTKEDIINRTIEKYMPEVADIKALTMEERLAKRLEGFSEGHTVLLFSLFTNLNEDNQLKMIDACQDREGIIQLIDFALENNGSE